MDTPLDLTPDNMPVKAQVMSFADLEFLCDVCMNVSCDTVKLDREKQVRIFSIFLTLGAMGRGSTLTITE